MTQVRNIQQTVPIWKSGGTETSHRLTPGRMTKQAVSIGLFGSTISIGGTDLPNIPALIESTVSQNVIAQMQTEIDELKARVAALAEEVEAMRASEEVVVLRTVSREEGKQEIKRLFEQGGTWYYSDIARQLRLELPLVVELCQELEEEGEIETDADNAV